MGSMFTKNELRILNSLYLEIVRTKVEEGADIDLEEYKNHSTLPTSFRKERSDHKKAVKLLSDAMADADIVETSLNWEVEDTEPDYSSENVEYLSDGSNDLFKLNADEELEISLSTKGGKTYKDKVLEDLAEGDSIYDSLERHYSQPRSRRCDGIYRHLRAQILDDEGFLPSEIQEDLSEALDVYHEKGAVAALN